MDAGSVSQSRKRSRSRSPYRSDRDRAKKHRSRSPHGKQNHHSRRHERDSVPVALPLKARPLEKRDFKQYEALFARYLDVQKQINVDEISDSEVKGRWKSFLGKWNRGELAEGWYDPEARWRAEDRWNNRTVQDDVQISQQVTRRDAPIPSPPRVEQDVVEEDSDDGYGPAPPIKEGRAIGAAIPNLQDLQHRRELADEARLNDRADLRHERKLDRNIQKERIEELAPRADPGSRERQMEKKADKTSTLHAFREAKDGGDVEVGEQEMMGGGEDEFKQQLKQRQKAKSEREIRKEEALRARIAEREERMRGVRAKEEKTMDMLKSIAKSRFG
ncbi:Putative style cell-cycle inhibitor 1 [Septoria linicola]|uniref:Style cell-cycle inhibitor 1 n=1 Tax=Septoria linicola TaxID=215465 RepID=A0A9Q9AT93_9PEZI|nr:putative style cell-cycle inhibitor 1 [Septoria linicola]USW55009.1 Putative style cell-cycle inhibitor 1 [Septoria linicola]